jgi:tetratricopeptide (TPR) repeat protein
MKVSVITVAAFLLAMGGREGRASGLEPFFPGGDGGKSNTQPHKPVPVDAASYRQAGDIYASEGKLTEALQAYEKSLELLGQPDADILKRMATLGTWTRKYNDAEQWLNRALSATPDDAEAREVLTDIRLRRSMHLFGSTGGWEIDYADAATETGLFLGWLDWLDLYGGYSSVDRQFYRRTNLWADAYLFPAYDFYVRVGGRSKRYDYPATINSKPDDNAYRNVPAVQLEGAYMHGDGNSVSLEVEYFQPNFYWSPSVKANNVKVTAAVQNWLVRPFYAKVSAALLRDPDPRRFTVDPVTKAVQGFEYETLGLLGGALGVEKGPVNVELKYVPDRDLDRSVRWSIFGKLSYRSENLGVQYDLLYDRYARTEGRGFSASRVNMLTVFFSPAHFLEVRSGAKILSNETTRVAPFVYVRVKTGV